MPDSVLTPQTIQVEHIKIESTKPFADVKAALENLVPRLDAGIFVLLQYGEGERARKELECGPELSIFNSRDHGGLLQITGQPRKAVQYDIGNPLFGQFGEDDATPAVGFAIRAAARRAVRERGRVCDL